MDRNELESLFSDLESDRVERKRSASNRDKIAEAICAFANDLPHHRAPGVIFVGVEDDGSCAGLPITDQLLQSLAAIRSDGNVLPTPTMDVRKERLRGCDVAVVVVYPAQRPPVRYKGRTCVRVGPRRGYATPEEEVRLSERSRAANLPFDVQPAYGVSLDDLDRAWIRENYLPAAIARDVLEQNQRDAEDQLASLRLATPRPNSTPTNLAVLLAAASPGSVMSGAYIQFLRLDGADLGDPILLEKRIEGPLAEALKNLNDALEINISTSVDISSGPVEVRRSDYPIAALRQLAYNAVMHRTYNASNAPIRIYWFADRIEIHSPGGPFGQVNRDNFGAPGITDYRNPHLAEAMKHLGYVQRFGAGIPQARRELRENGNPDPRFEVAETNIAVIVEKRR